MNWIELQEWAKARGKTTDDLVREFALQDVQAVKDMTDLEMVEWMMSGVKYDEAYCASNWIGFDDEMQQSVLQCMTERWNA